MVVASCSGGHGRGMLQGGQGRGTRGCREDDCRVRGGGGGGGRDGGKRRGGDGWRGESRVRGFGGEEHGGKEIAGGGGGEGRKGRKGRKGRRRGRGREEPGVRGGVYERGDGGGAAHAAVDAVDAAAGEAGADDEARDGAGDCQAWKLRGGEPALQPELGQGLSALRSAELPSQRGAGHAGESVIAPEDDDAEPRGVAEKNSGVSIEEELARNHKPRFARLNHVSVGNYSTSVQAACSQWWLHQLDECYFGSSKDQLHRTRIEVAIYFIFAPVEEVENVIASASVVAFDVMWTFTEGSYKKGKSILIWNFTSGAVKKAFQVSLFLLLFK